MTQETDLLEGRNDTKDRPLKGRNNARETDLLKGRNDAKETDLLEGRNDAKDRPSQGKK